MLGKGDPNEASPSSATLETLLTDAVQVVIGSDVTVLAVKDFLAFSKKSLRLLYAIAMVVWK